jgi:soluble lytic murein transglycosylase
VAYWTRVLMAATCVAALTGSAVAQNTVQDTPAAPGALTISVAAPTANDIEWVRTGMAAARAGNLDQVRTAEAAVIQPVARKILEWTAADLMGNRLTFTEMDQARRDLQGWPRRANRQAWAERDIEASGLSPQQVVDWFRAGDPATAEGAMALASAYQQLGRPGDAQALIKHYWRDRAFEADAQRLMLVRFGAMLTVDDHIKRADTLLYGQQGPAARDMLALLPADQQAVDAARMALRSNASNAADLFAAVPLEHLHDPGLAVEHARYLYERDMGLQALPLLADFPKNLPEDAASRFWLLRRQLVNVAVQSGDYVSAYRAVDGHGLPPGADAADAEFLGGWIALTKLHDPVRAEQYFARLSVIGASPITISRALYWRGRAEDAMGDPIAAQSYYGQGAKYYTTFYGQLAAAKAGITELVLDKDPVATPLDRARFDAAELVQASRILALANDHTLYRSMLIAAADSLPTAGDEALLVDFAQANGDQDLVMRIVRLAAQRGLILPERGYPLREPPDTSPVEAPYVLGIIRQESGFDARIRSGAGARGMMQLMPATARKLASRSGMRFNETMLDDPDYNMRLGSGFLGDLVSEFDGSYVMATAAYNAGPGRPPQWVAACGDPRAASTDPVDYIECIPIGETRNYVMRVLENVQVYRARLNGGHAPLKLVTDLKRGGYGQIASAYQTARNTLTPALTPTRTDTPVDVVASAPVPNPPEEAVIERTALEQGTIRHLKTQAELARRDGKVHKIKAKSRGGARHGKAKRRRS